MTHTTPTRPFRSASPFASLAMLGALAAIILVAPVALAGEEEGETATRRIDLPTLSTADHFPYTMEIPVTWELRREIPAPGVFVGPPGAHPDSDPEMVFVRLSDVDLSDPEAVVSSIESAAANQPWQTQQLEIFESDGKRGVWVLMEIPGDGTKPARRTLTVKLPVDEGSVDVMATAPVERFEALQPMFERVLRSIRPAVAEESPVAEEGGEQ